MPGVNFTTHTFIASPLATIFTPPVNYQEDVKCRDIQMRYIKCIQAYGYYKAYTECREYYDDFIECVYNGKQQSRALIINGEYERQKDAGTIREYLKPPFFASF